MGSFAIAKNGKIIYKRSIGYSSGDVLASENTLYHIGSVTKMFTAVMIFQLMDEGKLSLNTTLDKYFSHIPDAKQITIESLLDHRSGLYDILNDEEDQGFLTKPQTKAALLDKIITGERHFLPNTDFSYCNSGYLLLAYIIEKITGRTYDQNLQSRICAKAGLKRTYSPADNYIEKNEAFSYTFTSKWEKDSVTYLPNCIGYGSILSTPMDMILFSEALFKGKLVSTASLKLMKTFKDKTFGMGLMRVPFNNHKGYGHGGDIDGTHSLVADFTDDQLIFAYCMNGVNGQMYRNYVPMGILSIFYNLKYEIPTFKKISIPVDVLNDYAGIYANTELQLKITITNNGTVLFMQQSEQPMFEMDAVEKNIFRNDATGVVVQFNTSNNEMDIKLDGKSYLFIKDK